MKIRKILKYTFLLIFTAPVILICLIWLNSKIISLSTSGKMISDPGTLNRKYDVMIPGAGQYKPEQWINHSFNHRMEAAVELYKAGKVRNLILSGTYVSGLFNEANEMRNVLITFGVPDSIIIRDSTGFRTWESVSNIRKQFNLDETVIITQRSHLERSLFIAWCNGISAEGFEAKPVPHHHRYWNLREYLARIKATCDCFRHHTGL